MAKTLTKKEEFILISQIAQRAKRAGNPDDLLTINMDIDAAHRDVTLDLSALLAAEMISTSTMMFSGSGRTWTAPLASWAAFLYRDSRPSRSYKAGQDPSGLTSKLSHTVSPDR